MKKTRQKLVCRLALLAGLALAAGLLLGAAIASASSPSPSASADKVVLEIGWTVEPDTLNPFIGWQNQDYE
ncbi:MAG: hypothetical protein WCN81_16740, partial [Actinomycetes bacterium]